MYGYIVYVHVNVYILQIYKYILYIINIKYMMCKDVLDIINLNIYM